MYQYEGTLRTYPIYLFIVCFKIFLQKFGAFDICLYFQDKHTIIQGASKTVVHVLPDISDVKSKQIYVDKCIVL